MEPRAFEDEIDMAQVEGIKKRMRSMIKVFGLEETGKITSIYGGRACVGSGQVKFNLH